MKHSLNNVLLIFISIFLLGACAQKKTISGNQKLEKIKTSHLVKHLDSLSEKKWDFFYTKIATKYKSSKNKFSFRTTLKIKNDSAINATITFAAIPMMHILLTKEQLQIVNKRSKCYTKTLVDYLKNEFDFPFGYTQVEELLMGKPLAWSNRDRFKQIDNPNYYVLSTKKHRFESKEKKEGKINLNYFLSPDDLAIDKVLINSPEDTTSIVIEYAERTAIANHNIPQSVNVEIYNPNDSIFVELKYQKAEINNERRIVFIIPEKYDKCD